MADHYCSDLDRLLPQRCQRPVLHGARQHQPSQEVRQVVRLGEELQRRSRT
jgi:hypothetical protein